MRHANSSLGGDVLIKFWEEFVRILTEFHPLPLNKGWRSIFLYVSFFSKQLQHGTPRSNIINSNLKFPFLAKSFLQRLKKRRKLFFVVWFSLGVKSALFPSDGSIFSRCVKIGCWIKSSVLEKEVTEALRQQHISSTIFILKEYYFFFAIPT
jgi:hypothetical protein